MIRNITIFFALLCLFSCRDINENRNIIVFKDNIDTVQKALLHLQILLDSLPQVPEDASFLPHYVLQDDYLYLNNFKKYKISDTLKIPRLSKEASKTFMQLILFLDENFISSANKPISSKTWFFSYRQLYNEEYDYIREIVVCSEKNITLNLSFDNQILDRQKDILLMAPKNAIIDLK
jgi:hypothetical protein